ncbi:Cof-type HAD-IIB family hydrolase [Bacillus sp. T3]|uniref:Cof-type HAD-IIB family hydrolase n=1 Tax=Bacillus sp. T3 TaxID=467262 RepID=UPI002980DAF9|nr:Cof-type HAD-IIB family hydrolase [Bacillus sp. T3]
MSKIVFFDIDGTLLDHDKKLPMKTKMAIQQLKQNGVFVAIATGRAPFMFEGLRKELDVDSFVGYNGQYVVFENEVVYTNPLNHNEIVRLDQESKRNGHPLVFMDENTMKSSVAHHMYIEESMGSLKFVHPEQDSSFYYNKEILQVMIFMEEKDENLYNGLYPDFKLVRWHPYSVDVMPLGGSKAEGIQQLVKRLGFKMEDVYAFGDGLNDLEMLETVGTGVAMGNAVNELKEKAKFITKDVAEDGIWHGLKELELI